jgi:hypothetical protein
VETRPESATEGQELTTLKVLELKLKESQEQNDIFGMAESYGSLAKYYEDIGDVKKATQYRIFEDINKKELETQTGQNDLAASVSEPVINRSQGESAEESVKQEIKTAIKEIDGLLKNGKSAEGTAKQEIETPTPILDVATTLGTTITPTQQSLETEDTCPLCFGLMKNGICQLCGAKKCPSCGNVNDSATQTCTSCKFHL